jgi:hypothetical protein
MTCHLQLDTRHCAQFPGCGCAADPETAREATTIPSVRAIAFGWGAPSFAEQLPHLDREKAVAFDKDNAAIIRLSSRGLITASQRDAAIRKVTRAIEKEVG